MKPVLACALLLTLFSSCTKVKWAQVNVNEKYALQLPDYLEPGTFYKQASLQFKNEEKEFYLVVLDESRAQIKEYGLEYDLDTYFKVSARVLDSTEKVSPIRMVLNADSARSAEFTGKISGNDVYYNLVAVETKDNFYKLLIWMLKRDKELYAPDVTRIIHSFRELHKKTASL
jgi:hypothetical protein